MNVTNSSIISVVWFFSLLYSVYPILLLRVPTDGTAYYSALFNTISLVHVFWFFVFVFYFIFLPSLLSLRKFCMTSNMTYPFVPSYTKMCEVVFYLHFYFLHNIIVPYFVCLSSLYPIIGTSNVFFFPPDISTSWECPRFGFKRCFYVLHFN